MLKSLKSFITKNLLILSVFVSGASLVWFLLILNTQNTFTPDSFQRQFLNREKVQQKQLARVMTDWENLSKEQFFYRYFRQQDEFIVHVYERDSLVFWNSNKFPISNFIDNHFPINGLVKLQNGWYYSSIKKKGEISCVVSFGIKRQFPINNEHLTNYFFKPFQSTNATISPIIENGTKIKNAANIAVFSIQANTDSSVNQILFALVFFNILLLISLLIWLCYKQLINTLFKSVLFSASLIILRIVFLYQSPFTWMQGSTLFDPSTFALNELVPNLGELICWLLLLVYISPTIVKLIKIRQHRLISVLWLISIPVFIMIFPEFIRQIIINSTIPVHLGNILELNALSALLIGILGITWYGLFRYFQLVISASFGQQEKRKVFTIVIPAICLIVIIANEWIFRLHGFWVIWMFVTLLLAAYTRFHNKLVQTFNWHLITLLIVSAGITLNLETESKKKEREARILLANQLADERDMNAEIDYLLAKEKLQNEPFIKRLFIPTAAPTFSALKEAMEYRVFNGYWDRYDVDLYYYEQDSSHKIMNGFSKEQLDELISMHGTRSELDSSLYFIHDYTSQFNYLFNITLEKEGKNISLYGTLSSKRIPEKIGFPRILVSKQTAVYNLLEDYSVAKYYKGQLVFHSGEFIYPTVLSLFTNSRQAQQWISKNGFDHLVIQKSKTDAIILSYEQYSILSYFTSTALLMTCFGMLVIPFVFVNIRNRQESNSKLTLVSKIQFAFIGLIIVTLIGFSSVSSSLFSDQYHSYAVTQIAQKEASILEEIKQNDRSFKLQLLPKNSELLNYQLRKWASIFSSDINLFSVEGRLIGTSRNKIYSQGLLSEQMNPNAFEGLHYQNQGEFIQRENIGSLNYLSGYTPIFNHDKQLLGYLNVLHFNQQNMFDEQLKHFFVNILNVFMLLLVLSIVAAYTASSWITKPLIALRRSFSSMQLGKTNKRIHYIGDDEIGSLVTEYNQKLTELEETAKKLAQSERETAWREMAKQVAHEIKNPLTPMKLSIQHLQRVFDPTDPHIIEKINKATQSVIDQIDALTAIANEFSNFAKLPTAVMDDIDLAELVQSTISLFEANESCTITLSHDATENYHVIADKDMMLRVLNNLISNGIQAVAIDSSTNIFIELSSNDTEVVLRVKDNGKGISVDQLETIFEPYFTTKSTGTGLGLAMVKQIVELHHGTITVESSSSSGTCMRLVLPR